MSPSLKLTVLTLTVLTVFFAWQVNTLHCFSFLCLAASAVSFACAKPWPGRVALAAPFVLSALQALRPDSAEALALRLWQDVE